MGAVCDGVDLGIKSLLDSGLEKAEELEHELLRQSPQDEVRQTKECPVWYQRVDKIGF